MPYFRLLAIDVDGTLVNSRDQLTQPTRLALAEAAAAGICVVLATGRRYSRTLHLVEPLGIDVPLISASGALVKDPADHRTLYQAQFDPPLLQSVLSALDRSALDPLLCADTYTQGFDFYQARAEACNPWLGEYLHNNADAGRIWPLGSGLPPGVFQVFTMGTQGDMLALEGLLERELPGRLALHVLRSPKYAGYMCEIAPAGVTKGSAVCRLAADWGIAREAICAVGDDVNDIPMLRAAGLGVAMGNALPVVKAAADYIVPSHDEDGLVHLVRRLLES